MPELSEDPKDSTTLINRVVTQLDTDFPMADDLESFKLNLPLRVRIDLRSSNAAVFLCTALEKAINPSAGKSFCRHAFEYHSETEVKKSASEIISALENSTQKMRTTVRIIELPNGVETHVGRVEIATPSEISTPMLPLYQQVALSVDLTNEEGFLDEDIINDYANNLGVPFALLTGIYAGFNVELIIDALSLSFPQIQSNNEHLLESLEIIRDSLFGNE